MSTLNRRRKYLHILPVANIASGYVIKILEYQLQGKRSKRRPQYRWAPQIRPDKSSWTLWNEAITTSPELDKTNILLKQDEWENGCKINHLQTGGTRHQRTGCMIKSMEFGTRYYQY